MNKKAIAYILIGIGASDILLWLINGFEFGWLEFVVGVNVVSEYGAWTMIAIGFWIIRKQKAIEKSEIDDVADLDEEENVAYKQINASTIVTVTNKKIIYRCFDDINEIVNKNNNVLADEKVIFPYDEIDSVAPVKTKETAKTNLGGMLNINFGIQLKLKDGTVYNIPTTKGELICAHINKLINKS